MAKKAEEGGPYDKTFEIEEAEAFGLWGKPVASYFPRCGNR